MKLTPVTAIPSLPDSLQPFLSGAKLYDSSCSPNARVWLAEGKEDVFLKKAPKGSLETEVSMAAFFHNKGFGPQVLAFVQSDSDWLVTRRIPGRDCLADPYLADPKRLSETLGILLRMLHGTDPTGCPVSDCNPEWITPESRVLIHGDYCLPNVILDKWDFSGFLDVGGGGIGDRNLDLYWGCWSILYNLKEDRWCTRFLDAYGRSDINTDQLRIQHSFEFSD